MKTVEENKTLEFENAVAKTWDETVEGKELIIKLLNQSQQEARAGKLITDKEMNLKIKARLENRQIYA